MLYNNLKHQKQHTQSWRKAVRGKVIFIVESVGYSYTAKRANKSSTVWRCITCNKKQECKATVKQTNDTFVRGPIDNCHEFLPELLATAKVKAKGMYFKLLILACKHIEVAISEFGFSMLMLILLNNFMFNEVMRYLHDNKWFGNQ